MKESLESLAKKTLAFLESSGASMHSADKETVRALAEAALEVVAFVECEEAASNRKMFV